MTPHDRIEHALRAGPPEEGSYRPSPVDEIVAGRSDRPTARPGLTILAAAVVVLLVGLGAVLLIPRAPADPGQGAAPGGLLMTSWTPDATPGPSPTDRVCVPDDVALELVRSQDEDADGMTVWLRVQMLGRNTCLLEPAAVATIEDAAGTILMDSGLIERAGGPLPPWWLVPGATSGAEVRILDWCGDASTAPYILRVRLASGTLAPVELDRSPRCTATGTAPTITPLMRASRIDARLPTLGGLDDLCRDVGLVNAILVADASDPGMVWLQHANGDRTDLVWPKGYRVRFSGEAFERARILDADGVIVLRPGDRIDGACVTGDPGVLRIQRDRE